jgi:hypothetical protein
VGDNLGPVGGLLKRFQSVFRAFSERFQIVVKVYLESGETVLECADLCCLTPNLPDTVSVFRVVRVWIQDASLSFSFNSGKNLFLQLLKQQYPVKNSISILSENTIKKRSYISIFVKRSVLFE